jgi:4-aminobutyrate aminotransferase-like enzyme
MGQLFSGGSECIEATIRLSKAFTGKKEFISFYNGFHGKTLASMGLSEVRHPSEAPRAPSFSRTPYGHCYHCAFKMEYPDCDLFCADFVKEVLQHQTTGDVAGIVLEPIQGWAGTIVPPDDWMSRLRKLCDDLGILLIADEILTCCGRTGKMWCVENYNVIPDIITMGKGFGSGYPVTAFMTTEEIMEKCPPHAFSTSYGSNPVACAAALASLKVIEKERLVENAARVGKFMIKRLKEIQEEHEIVGEVRGKGLLLGMELVKSRKSREPFREAGYLAYRKSFEKGLAWVPAHQNLRIAPALIIDEELADKGLRIIDEALKETEKELKGKYGD